MSQPQLSRVRSNLIELAIDRFTDPRSDSQTVHSDRSCTADSIDAADTRLFEEVCGAEMEGVVAKRKDGLYDPTVTYWIKIKNRGYSNCTGAVNCLNDGVEQWRDEGAVPDLRSNESDVKTYRLSVGLGLRPPENILKNHFYAELFRPILRVWVVHP